MIFGAGSGIVLRIPALLALSLIGCGPNLRDGVYAGTAPSAPDPSGIATTVAKVSITIRGTGWEGAIAGIPMRGRVEGANLVATERFGRRIEPAAAIGKIVEGDTGFSWRPMEGATIPLTVQPLPLR